VRGIMKVISVFIWFSKGSDEDKLIFQNRAIEQGNSSTTDPGN